jgi:acetyl esterase/lipase
MRRCIIGAVVLGMLAASPLLAQERKPPVRVENDLVYGKVGDTELKLDLAMPKDGDGPFPAVLWIHGGAWQGGKRSELTKVAELSAARGYVAVTIDYRLAPDARFPAQIEDCKAAVRWLRAESKKYKIDPDRIGVVGFSAGAHLACLLGATTKDDGFEGTGGNPDQASTVRAVVSFFGPTDLTTRTWSDELERKLLVPFVGASFADKPELYRKVSPITYVRKEAPPFLFFHGTEDKLVAVRQSEVMVEKLKAVSVPAELVKLEGEGHGFHGENVRQTLDKTFQFLDERLKKP